MRSSECNPELQAAAKHPWAAELFFHFTQCTVSVPSETEITPSHLFSSCSCTNTTQPGMPVPACRVILLASLGREAICCDNATGSP